MFDPTLITSLLAPAWVPSMPELIVILVIGLLLFGRKLPEIGRSLGQGIRQFKSGLNEVADQAIPPTQANHPQPPMPQQMYQTGQQPAMPPAMYQTGQQPAVPPGGYYPYYPPPGYYPPQPQQPMLGPDGKPLPPPPPGYGYYPLPPQPQAQPSGIQQNPPSNTSQRG